MTETAPVRRALLSVADKTGLIEFAKRLAAMDIELVSTGGTATALRDAGLPVTDVAALTGFAEFLDGRVKTLHPAIHGGLLADLSKADHQAALDAQAIAPIGLVVSNLYPFEAAIEAGDDAATLVERIDVGGPTMTRAAAKNLAHVGVVVDVDDYDVVAAAMEAAGGAIPWSIRRRLSAKAFARLAAYDAAIARWLAAETAADDVPVDHMVWQAFGGRRLAKMRYGENPHQQAALYGTHTGLAGARVVQGKPLSYNNIADADAAWAAVADFSDRPAAVIVKHANPCGIAIADDLETAYEKARRCDPVSAFGGVVALSRAIDRASAEAIAKIFTEVLIAPDASAEALDVLSRKSALRVLLTGEPATADTVIKSVSGGFLVQSGDDGVIGDVDMPTARAPSDQEWKDLRFAWRAVKHVKSNAIVFARDGATVGIGAGQMSRVDAARIAAWKAADAGKEAGEEVLRTAGSVAASDAFFPFPDGLEVIAKAGATAVVQPGGSKRDGDVIAAADAHNIAMLLTGMRHFRH